MSGDQPKTHVQPTNTKPEDFDSHSHTTNNTLYPKLDPNDVVPPPPQPGATATDVATTMPTKSNPNVTPAPFPTPAKSLFSLLGEVRKRVDDLVDDLNKLFTGPFYTEPQV
ncbi:GEM-like protein 1 [Trifolium medium]|uniref:GEM-like protein 1 n=1 Tax=Trifolium medium TaxID=97028 RepID=A0A392MFV6_9FABA|nr:GEM-like protein 1 [Trifolium medium]